MPETEVAPQSDVKTPGKIVSAGKPTLATVGLTNAPANENAGDAGAAAAANAGAAGGEQLTEEQKLAAANADKNKGPELTDEQLKDLLKARGIELDDTGLDGLKAKLTPAAPAAAEPTAEEKQKAEAAEEKRMLDLFIAGGGSIENFANLKQVASADLTALSESEIRRELKAENFSDDEINAIIKERYYQINPEELVQGDDETPEDFAKRKALIEKKIALGTKEFSSKALSIKKQSEDALGILRNAIKEQDLQKQKEALISSKADEIASVLPRELTFDLGEVDGLKIDPVTIKVADADVAEVVAILKNSEERNKLLFNEDNSLNLSSIGNILLRNKMLEASVKASLLEGESRQVAKFEKIFPGRTAKEIGVGGNNGAGNQGRAGVIASRGKPEVVRR